MDVGARSIPVYNGQGVKVMSVMPPTVSPEGGSFAFRGTEAGIVGSTACQKLNHRVVEGSEYISMPGLFPRMLDLEFGPDGVVTVDQCRDAGPAKMQTLGDILHFDYYARGGGLFPGWWLSGDTLDQQARNQVFSTDTSNPMTAPASAVCTTAHDSANRCTGPCDVTKVIVDSVVGALSVGLGVFAGAFGDFGVIVKLLGLEVAVGGGTSIMNAAGADSGSLEIQKNTKLFHARLRDTADGFLIRSDGTVHNSSLTTYLNFPSMIYGCANDDCSGPSGNQAHQSTENPVYHNGKAGSYTYTQANDVWAGETRLHRTQTVAGNLACATVDDGGGDFKRDISSIHISDVRRIKASGNMVEFGIVDANTMSELTSGGKRLYALHNSARETASPFPKSLGPECSLCSSIGTPGETTRPRCSIKGQGAQSTAKDVSYDLSAQGSGVGLDIHAKEVFFAPDADNKPKIESTKGVCVYGYFADAGDDPIACSDTTDAGNVVNRLLGYVVGGSNSGGVPTSPCISNNDVVEVCSFDTGLRLNDTSFASCQTFPADWETSCPSPRWSNDERVVFPSEIADDEPTYPRLPNDFDSKALYTSYCANSWGQTSDSKPFQDKSWFMTSTKKPFLGAPSTWLSDSQMYVYCAGDKLSVGERHEFCGGADGIPEGRGTYEGLRLENRQELSQVCKNTGTPAAPKQTCLLYVSDPGPFGNPTRINDIAAAFPSTDVEIVIVPANFTAVSMMALYLAFVDTTYYNDASYAPPSLHREANDSYVIGRKMKLRWSDSAKIVPHMCSSSPDVDFFAHLYAWIERHRNGNSNTYTFFNLDSGTGPGQDQTLTMTDAELYPGIQMQGVVKPGLARITVRSAFDSTVAAAAAAILGRDSLPPRWAHFRPSPIGGDCTRFSLESRASFSFVSFDMSGPCETVPPGRRVPIVYQGGSTVDTSVVRDVRCFGCGSGLVSARGSATTVNIEAAPDLDVEQAVFGHSEMIPSFPSNANSCGNLTTCSDTTLPGLFASLARTVGDAAIIECGAKRAGQNQFCDLVLEAGDPNSVGAVEIQFVGGPFFGRRAIPCVAPESGCSGLFAPNPLVPFRRDTSASDVQIQTCVETSPNFPSDAENPKRIRWTCENPNGFGKRLFATEYTPDPDGDADDEPNVCPWSDYTDVDEGSDNLPPCVPEGFAYAKLSSGTSLPAGYPTDPGTFSGNSVVNEAADIDPEDAADDGKTALVPWLAAQMATLAGASRCSFRGCPAGPSPSGSPFCVPPPGVGAGGVSGTQLRQEWWMTPDSDGIPVGVPFSDLRGADSGVADSPHEVVVLPLPEDYETLRIRQTSDSAGLGVFFVDGLVLGNPTDTEGEFDFSGGQCLARATRPFTSTVLEAQPCADGIRGQNQQWLFVYHPEKALWRLQSANADECITWVSVSGDDDGGGAVMLPCEACHTGVEIATMASIPSLSSATFPDLMPSTGNLGSAETLMALDAENASVMLRIDTATGQCAVRPDISADLVAIFSGFTTGTIPCDSILTASRAELERVYGPVICTGGRPIGALRTACGLNGAALGGVNGEATDFETLCRGGTGRRYSVSSDGGGTDAVVECFGAARPGVGVDQTGTSSAPVLRVVNGGRNFADGQLLQFGAINPQDESIATSSTLNVRMTAIVAKVIFQPFESGLDSVPLTNALVINTTELFALEGIGSVLQVARAELRSSVATWTGVVIQVVIISMAILVHVLSISPGVGDNEEQSG